MFFILSKTEYFKKNNTLRFTMIDFSPVDDLRRQKVAT